MTLRSISLAAGLIRASRSSSFILAMVMLDVPILRTRPISTNCSIWAQVFMKLAAMDHLVYCAPQLTGALFAECRVPGVDGGAGLESIGHDPDHAAAMVQNAIDVYLSEHPSSAIAILADGPYGVPREE